MVTSTCCTALTMPRRVENSTVRSLTSSSGTVSAVVIAITSRAALRIDDVAQAVAEQVETEHRDHQRGSREECDPPFPRHHEGGALRYHDPPFRRGRAYAEPDERQACGIEDGVAHGERHLLHHDRHDIGQDLSEQ